MLAISLGESATRRQETGRTENSSGNVSVGSQRCLPVAVVDAQAEAGDIVSAIKTGSMIGTARYRAEARTIIGRNQARSGDGAGAAYTFAQAHRDAVNIKARLPRVKVLAEIGLAQAQSGDKEGSNDTLAMALEAAKRVEVAGQRSEALAHIARAQAMSGDIEGALKTAAMEEVAGRRTRVLAHIARAQVQWGDVPGARETAAKIEETWHRAKTVADIAVMQAVAAGKPVGEYACARNAAADAN